ncbi:MAG: hypothetical protein ACOCQL_05040, partial [Halolamina sp.]
IYERRVGKVVKMASFAAADMPVEEEGLTTQERDLFDDMVGRIGENRSRVLDILAGEGDSVPASSVGAPGAQPEPTESTTQEPTESSADEPARPSAEGGPSRDEPAVGTGTTADAPAETEEAPPAPPDAPPREAEEPTDPRSDGGVAASSAADEPERESDDDRTTVRVTEDVGRLLGVDDREYELESDDVVSLPEDNAEALLQREAAEELW